MSKKITVLYVFHEAMSSGGATYSGMNMIRSLNRGDDGIIFPIVIVPAEGDVKEKMEAIGVKCIVSPVRTLFRSHDNSDLLHRFVHTSRKLKHCMQDFISNCLDVRRELGNYHIDIVHSNTAAILTGFVLSKYLHCKHVWHLREFIDKDFHQKPYIGFGLLRKLINSATATIAITNAVREHWILEDTKNSFQMFNAVKSISSLSPIIPQKDKYFLFCANIIASYKGANWAMKGFCQSKMYQEGYRLLYIGNCRPEYKDQLLDIARKEGAEDMVEFLGYRKDTTPYFAKATAFLMCSDNEAMGRTTIEAFWSGCPVIGRNTGGTPELIHGGENGYPFDTIDELADLMRKVAQQDNSKVVEHAREFAMQNFTEEEYGKKIEDVYRTVMGLHYVQEG